MKDLTKDSQDIIDAFIALAAHEAADCVRTKLPPCLELQDAIDLLVPRYIDRDTAAGLLFHKVMLLTSGGVVDE